jgi:hypothetical protein
MSEEKLPAQHLLDSAAQGELPLFDPAKHFITIFLHRTEEAAEAFCAMLNGEKSDV